MVGESGTRAGVLLRIAVVLVLAVVCVGIGLVLMQRNRSADAAADRAAQSFTPPPVTVTGPALVSVISDETSGAVPGSVASRTAPKPWMSYVSSSVSVRIAPFIVPRSGYTKTGTSSSNGGSTFVTRAGDVSATSRVVLFIGGGADRSSPRLDVIKAATNALAQARSVAPKAHVIVVGPAAETSTPPTDVLAVRDTLRSAADVADATFVDPIARGWLQQPQDWSSAGTLTAAGQKELGGRLTTVLRSEFDDGA